MAMMMDGIQVKKLRYADGILCERSLSKDYERWILPYFELSNKVILGGSIALNMLNLMKLDYSLRKPDLDFSLTEAFTQHELSTIVDFFDLKRRDKNPYGPEGKAFVDDNILKQDLILFSKVEKVETVNNYKEDIQVYKVDFFNKDYLTKRDVIPVKYIDHDGNKWDIKLTHPSIILAAKARYAFDTRIGKQFKHWEDLEELFYRKNSDNYFKTMKDIERVIDDQNRKLERAKKTMWI
jgi:hypothetical protein